MENLIKIAQLAVSISVLFVWIFRFENIVTEFKQFGLSDLSRSFVGASKIALATLLIAGIWHQSLVLFPAVLMGCFMIAGQYFHFKVKNPYKKHFPSFILLIICAFIVLESI